MRPARLDILASFIDVRDADDEEERKRGEDLA